MLQDEIPESNTSNTKGSGRLASTLRVLEGIYFVRNHTPNTHHLSSNFARRLLAEGLGGN